MLGEEIKMIKISKYQGLGNDFIICLDQDLLTKDYSQLAKELCNNQITGVTDGLICVKTNPLTMIFYNQDGSIGTMCGNGLRCFVKYCYDNKIISTNKNTILTGAGYYETEIISTDPFMVEVKMNKPDYSNQLLKIKTNKEEFINEKISFQNKDYYLNCVFMGTHHTVIFVDDLKEVDEELGRFMCHLPIFDDRTNVDFVQIESRNKLLVRTYERGVGFTLACGTGACASFVIAKRFAKCDNWVDVCFENGSLRISQKEDNVYMLGPSELVATWKYSLNNCSSIFSYNNKSKK